MKPERIEIEMHDGAGQRWREAMRTFTTFNVTNEQIDGWRGTQEFAPGTQYKVAFPFDTFCLRPEPGFLGIQQTDLYERPTTDDGFAPGPVDDVFVRSRLDGIAVERYENGWEFFVCWLGYSFADSAYTDLLATKRLIGSARIDDSYEALDVPAPKWDQPGVSVPWTKGSVSEKTADPRKLIIWGVTILMRFLYTLDHRKVKVLEATDPQRPPNRQQRRAEQYVERDHYRIYIPPTLTIRRAVHEVATEPSCRREVQWNSPVRGHKRRDKYGRKRIFVHPHKRNKHLPDRPGRDGYAAHDVGMEGLEP